MNFTVLGSGSALPAFVRTNDDLAQILDTSDAWIYSRTGIRRRHIMTTETVTELALEAAQKALEQAGVSPEELDYIICPTVGGDYITPGLGCTLQAALGARCPAIDLNAGCSGFLYGLDVAEGLFAGKKAKLALIAAAEGISRIMDWTDRSTCVLFGDGAGAAVLGAGDSLRYIRLKTHGCSAPLHGLFPMGNSPWLKQSPHTHFVHMEGQEVYKFAVHEICSSIEEALKSTGLQPEDIHHVLLHQANMRIIDAARKKLSIPEDRYHCCIEETGNLSAASIPTLLDRCSRKNLFHKGENLLLCAFGAGFTSGTAILRWEKENGGDKGIS